MNVLREKSEFENNYNFVRLFAAACVIFSHAFEISSGQADFLHQLIGYSGGWVAVSAFFSMSGYLIYNSAIRSTGIKSYFAARVLRIFPALWVTLAITGAGALIAGQFNSNVVFSDVIRYFFGNAFLYFPRYFIGDIFSTNIYSGVINGSLWTLRFEFTCYIMVAALLATGVIRKRRMQTLFFLCYFVVYFALLFNAIYRSELDQFLYDGNSIAKFHRLSLAFVLGMLMAAYNGAMKTNFFHLLILAALCVIFLGTSIFSTVLIMLICGLVFWIGNLQLTALRAFRSLPDISYGLYIYGFPIQQLVEFFFPASTPLQNASLALAVSVVPATFSWYFIEKPALGLKQYFR